MLARLLVLISVLAAMPVANAESGKEARPRFKSEAVTKPEQGYGQNPLRENILDVWVRKWCRPCVASFQKMSLR
jgi:hypothetical protein